MSTSLLVTIILMVLVLAISIGMWARHHRARPLVGGLGLMLVPLGLYFLGVMDLTVNGVNSLISWFQRMEWSTIMTWGAGLAGGGLLLALISLFLPKGPKEPKEPTAGQRPVAGAQRPQVSGRPAGQAAQPSQPAAAKAQPAKPAGKPAKGLSDEDREIEELLKKRGIM